MGDIGGERVFASAHKDSMIKLMIEAQVEKLFESAYLSNRSLFSNKWQTAQGFAKGAAASIDKVKDDKLARTLTMAIAQHILVQEYKVPLENARSLIAQYLYLALIKMSR